MCFNLKLIYKTKSDLIFNYMKEHDLDLSQFCKKCKITIKELSDVLKNDPYIDTIVFLKIIGILKIKPLDLFE